MGVERADFRLRAGFEVNSPTAIRASGATSLRAIAAELDARGMLTRRGGGWHVSNVASLLDRLGVARARDAHCSRISRIGRS